jgi:hypothetical protein
LFLFRNGPGWPAFNIILRPERPARVARPAAALAGRSRRGGAGGLGLRSRGSAPSKVVPVDFEQRARKDSAAAMPASFADLLKATKKQ